MRATITEGVVVALTAMAPAACASTQPTTPPPEAPIDDAPRTEIERYLPAPHDTVYAYDTVDEESGETGVLMMHVTRPRPGRADLETGSRTERLSLSADGIEYLEGGFLLRPPLSAGATWQGRMGRVTVEQADVIARVPAGTFADCVTTREEATGAAGSRVVRSTYCRDVGLVQLRVDAVTDEGMLSQRVELRSFGPRVDLGAPAAPR